MGTVVGKYSDDVGCAYVGGCKVDISGGCLKGVDLRHFKPWLLTFYRPYRVSKKAASNKAIQSYKEMVHKSEGCRVVSGVKVSGGVK